MQDGQSAFPPESGLDRPLIDGLGQELCQLFAMLAVEVSIGMSSPSVAARIVDFPSEFPRHRSASRSEGERFPTARCGKSRSVEGGATTVQRAIRGGRAACPIDSARVRVPAPVKRRLFFSWRGRRPKRTRMRVWRCAACRILSRAAAEGGSGRFRPPRIPRSTQPTSSFRV